MNKCLMPTPKCVLKKVMKRIYVQPKKKGGGRVFWEICLVLKGNLEGFYLKNLFKKITQVSSPRCLSIPTLLRSFVQLEKKSPPIK